MNKIFRTSLAVLSCATILATATACGDQKTVFDEMNKVLSIEEGDFFLQTSIQADDMNISLGGSGQFSPDAFSLTFEQCNIKTSDMDFALNGLTVVFVDNTVYVPVSSITGIVQSVMGSDEADSTMTFDGQEYEWIGVKLDTIEDTVDSTLIGSDSESGTTDIEDVPSEMKTYLTNTVIPALNKNFGALEGKVLYTDGQGSHFRMNNETASAALTALRNCIANGDFETVLSEGYKIMGQTMPADFDKESINSELDDLIAQINDSGAKFDVDLYAVDNKQESVIGAVFTASDNSSNLDGHFSWTVDAKKVAISAPENAYVVEDITSLFTSLLTPGLDSALGSIGDLGSGLDTDLGIDFNSLPDLDYSDFGDMDFGDFGDMFE